MLRAREALRTEYQVLHRAVLAIVREDTTCRRLMGVPGVGALVAITFTSAVDDPARFGRSRAVGAHFGLTPKRYQSGETDVTGGISKVGDAMVRTALYEAANVMLTRAGRFSTLKRWALGAGRWAWRSVGACGGRRWRWRASSRPCCTACGSTGASSASAGRRQRRDRLTGEESEFGAGRVGPAPLGSRRRDAGTGKAADPGVASPRRRPRAPRSARRLPSDRMVWRPWRRPRTEARARRQDDHSRGLTPDGPLRKPGLFTGMGDVRCGASSPAAALTAIAPRTGKADE